MTGDGCPDCRAEKVAARAAAARERAEAVAAEVARNGLVASGARRRELLAAAAARAGRPFTALAARRKTGG